MFKMIYYGDGSHRLTITEDGCDDVTMYISIKTEKVLDDLILQSRNMLTDKERTKLL